MIFFCAQCHWAQNREIATLQEGDACPKCRGVIASVKTIEVGNIFRLGTRFAEAEGLYYTDEKGLKKPVVMGSYGIGPSRVMGTIAETHADARGIAWPASVAPYACHLVVLGHDRTPARKSADKLYGRMIAKGVDVLYDDRDDKTAGEKFADADIIGIPWRVVVSSATLAKKAVELKGRTQKEARMISEQKLIQKLLALQI
jgi:prolyl-tRNA synthetase